MKLLLFFILLAFVLAGCEQGDTIASGETESGAVVETEADIKPISGPETIPAESTPIEAPIEETATPILMLPQLTFSLRSQDADLFPEGFVIDDAFTDALAHEIAEQVGGRDVLARVVFLQGYWDEAGTSHIFAEYEVYPVGARIWESSHLVTFSCGLTYTEAGGYGHGEPIWIDESAPQTLADKYDAYDPSWEQLPPGSTLLSPYLNEENYVCIYHDNVEYVTDIQFREGIAWLEDRVAVYANMGRLLVCAHDDSTGEVRLKITYSRDSGETWHSFLPELEPLGANGQHKEPGFTAAQLQITEAGDYYIFLGTNLASMTVLRIPANEDTVEVLWREQIGGYETTALVHARMVTETRGFYTLKHPKYRESNAIYRTTDGGHSWVRCNVPMPESIKNPYDMELSLPYQQAEYDVHTWFMQGAWGMEDGCQCMYISTDGGWTWEVMEN